MNILVVDDSKAMRMIVTRTLRQAGFGDHTIKEATDGANALGVMSEFTPDLVLCDWNMPEMSGIEFLEKLRADDNQVRFGFVTSEANPEMKSKATDAGASFFITKPFTVEMFQQTLESVLA